MEGIYNNNITFWLEFSPHFFPIIPFSIYIQDEGAAQLQKASRHYIRQTFDSRKIHSLGYRDMWAFVSVNHQWIVEGHRKAVPGGWGLPVDVQAFIALEQDYAEQCNWGEGEILERRKQLCNRYEGYGSVCDCKYFHFGLLEWKRYLAIILNKKCSFLIMEEKW